MYIDHAPIKFLMARKDGKSRLIKWVILLQECDIEIKEKRGNYNVIADHLSRIEKPDEEKIETEIKENFLDEQLF